ncbi:putative chitin catabolic cascade sensor histidine kinase ChiS, partial [Vibrio parahaemolyticus V-223/04]
SNAQILMIFCWSILTAT